MLRYRTRLALSVVVLVLVAAACGSDEHQPAPPGDAEAGAISDATPVADPEPADAPDPPETAAPDTAPVPRLGDRFELCREVQSARDAVADTRPPFEAATSAVRDAEAAVAATTDDLDRAVANEALVEAEAALWRAQEGYDTAVRRGATELSRAMWAHGEGLTDTGNIARSRAWEAFMGAMDETTLAVRAHVDAMTAAEAAAAAATADAERAYDEAYEQAVADAEAAITAAQAAHTAAVDAFADEHDVPEEDRGRLVFPQDWPTLRALGEAKDHLNAVQAEETPELVALRETIRVLTLAHRDSIGATTDAEDARGDDLVRNVEVHSAAYVAFLRSFYESCQQ